VPLCQAFDLGSEFVLHVNLECDAPVDDFAGVAGGDEGALVGAEDVFEQAEDDVVVDVCRAGGAVVVVVAGVELDHRRGDRVGQLVAS
jgi:hypothetical protein